MNSRDSGSGWWRLLLLCEATKNFWSVTGRRDSQVLVLLIHKHGYGRRALDTVCMTVILYLPQAYSLLPLDMNLAIVILPPRPSSV